MKKKIFEALTQNREGLFLSSSVRHRSKLVTVNDHAVVAVRAEFARHPPCRSADDVLYSRRAKLRRRLLGRCGQFIGQILQDCPHKVVNRGRGYVPIVTN
jgi:hypothetical protein